VLANHRQIKAKGVFSIGKRLFVQLRILSIFKSLLFLFSWNRQEDDDVPAPLKLRFYAEAVKTDGR
jgi:hypothetical protein